jgi:uncharacterized membrane protein
MGVQWAPLTAAFLASTVEFVEAFTIVLVVGVAVNWKSSLVGAAAAVAALALIVGTLGTALVIYVPLAVLRVAVGVLLVLFGLKWLKKAILRYAGLKAMHDEEAIYEEEMALLRAAGEAPSNKLDSFGVVTSFKSVLLEGLEVAFIVITFGSINANGAPANGTVAAHNSIGWAALGAGLALLLVGGIGVAVHAPLARVPENLLKFVVGIMLASFGTFWGGEGIGINWPLADLFLVVLVVFYLAVCLALIAWLHGYAPRKAVLAGGDELPAQEVLG